MDFFSVLDGFGCVPVRCGVYRESKQQPSNNNNALLSLEVQQERKMSILNFSSEQIKRRK
jgi:hypothetical protein